MVSQTASRPCPGTLCGKIVPAGVGLPPGDVFWSAQTRKVRNRHDDGEPRMPMPDSVVLAVLARLGHRQRTLEPVIAVGVDPQPLRR
jgi:hypothetical protein